MPNIKEFAPAQLGLNPTEVGVEATTAAARRGNAFFNEAAQSVQTTGERFGSAIRDAGDAAVKYVEHREISAGAANLAQINENLSKQWNDTAKNADPNDPAVAGKFREEVVEPTLSQFKDGFNTEGGQRWAETHIDRSREHYFHKTSADMSSLAADAVHTNVLKTVNSLGSTTYNDPSSLKFSLDMLKGSVEGMADSSPTLTPVAAAKVKNDLMMQGTQHVVRSAIMGAIAKGGDWQRIANDPAYTPYVNQAEVETFARAAKAQARADALTQKQLETYKHQQDVRTSDTNISKILSDAVSFDANGHATIKPEIFKNLMENERQFPGVTTERTKAVINWAQSQQKEKRETIISKPEVRNSLYDGMFKTDKPTTDVEIYSAAARHDIDAHDTQTLLGMVKALDEHPLKGPIFHDTLAAVKGQLGTDPKGMEAYGKFIPSFIPEYIRQSRAGTLQPNALDLRDPNSLISQAMAPYKRTPYQMLIDRASHGLVGSGDNAPINLTVTPPANTNLTAPGNTVTGMEVVNVPAGMTPAQAMKHFKSNTRIRLPDGRIGTVP